MIDERELGVRIASDLFPLVASNRPAALRLWQERQNSEMTRERLAEWAEQRQGPDHLEEARRAMLPGLLMTEERFARIPRQWAGVFERSTATSCRQRDSSEGVVAEYTGIMLRRMGKCGLVFSGRLANGNTVEVPGYRLDLGAKVNVDAMDAQFAPMALGIAKNFVQVEEVLHADALDGAVLPDENLINATLDIQGLMSMKERIATSRRAEPTEDARKLTFIIPITLELKAHALFRDLGNLSIGDSYRVLDYLNQPKKWYARTPKPSLISLGFEPFKLDLKIEDENLVLVGTQAYGCGLTDPSTLFGAIPGA